MKIAMGLGVALLLGLLGALGVHGQGDLTPPVLVDVQIEPAVIDTRDSDQWITVTARITDDLSGFRSAWLLFKPLVGTEQRLDFNYSERERVSGTALDGVYVYATVMPRYAAEGRWVLDGVQTYDQVGNLFNSSPRSTDWPARFDGYHFANVFDTTPTPTITPTPTFTPWPTPAFTFTPTPSSLYLPAIWRSGLQ